MVETKGSHNVLRYERIFFTSNISPEEWYPNVNQLTRDALLRRLIVYEFPKDLERVKQDFGLE